MNTMNTNSYAYREQYEGSTVIDMTPNAAPLFTHTNVWHVNRFDYTAPESSKKLTKKDAQAEQAIIDTVKCLGWMSLKDSDHYEYAKAVGQGEARRRAADRMIADGRVVLMGTWSNGIAVGPGVGFTDVVAVEERPAAPVAQKIATRKTRGPVKGKRDIDFNNPAWSQAGAVCEIRYDDGASCKVTRPMALVYRIVERSLGLSGVRYFEVRRGDEFIRQYMNRTDAERCITRMENPIEPAMHGPAYVAKPRVRYTWPKIATAPTAPAVTIKDTQLAKLNMQQVQAREEHRTGEFCEWQPGIRLQAAKLQASAPTPIYQPAAGESVFIVLRHENGTTTDRVVDVQRVKIEHGVVVLFRGYDRRRDRCRNYVVADCLVLRQWDGEAVYDMNGREVVAAA